ncbi:MAG TPA: Rieske 2Fe-2S domain-containing protein [Anaerolineae bacterium]|jgi:nitrite reductase/ring-hydroxylating ferredoxin subunit
MPSLDVDNQSSRVHSAALNENEFFLDDIAMGAIGLVQLNGERVAVHHASDGFYATDDRCPHTGWPLSDGGELVGHEVTCAMHGWCFNITDGSVVRGMKSLKIQTYRVIIDGDIGRVELV